MFVCHNPNGFYKPIKIWRKDQDDLEAGALEQLKRVASLPFIFRHVAAMPDVHWGMGATVGSVIATVGAVVPSAVGVDIGCGMMAWRTGLPAEALRSVAPQLRGWIERAVPTGFNMHQKPIQESDVFFTRREERFAGPLWAQRDPSRPKNMEIHPAVEKARLQLGTLGGGNHFIEVCEDEDGVAWVMLHSGSRGIGKLTADVYMKAAKDGCRLWGSNLPDPDLAFLPEGTEEYRSYSRDLIWCQEYAWANRQAMMYLVSREIRHAAIKAGLSPDGVRDDFKELGQDLVHCHHNYAHMEYHFGALVLVTRKGAISAREGEFGIIPGSMGARSYIVIGLGNPESFQSASHGAGRRMGRNEAKRQFSVADLAEQTAGVECRKDEGVLDELPGAYKDIDEVMELQKDLVRPVHVLKQFLCVKG